MGRLLWLALLVVGAGAACPGVQVVPLPYYATQQFGPLTMPSLQKALDAAYVRAAARTAGYTAPTAWRVVAEWDVPSYEHVTMAMAHDDDSGVAWSCAITDGGGEFFNFGGGASSSNLKGGAYSLTCDVVSATLSGEAPAFTTRSYVPSWSACPPVYPSPTCALVEEIQHFSQFADSEADRVTFTATIATGTARCAVSHNAIKR